MAEIVDRPSRSKTKSESVEFVWWDGEGTHAGNDVPQNYSLFGAFDGVEYHFVERQSLSTAECLQLIIDVGALHPKRVHVAFAFGYDVTMICKDLSAEHFEKLVKKGFCRWGRFRIEHLEGKWLRVTRYGDEYENNRNDYQSTRIFDVWGFFQSSFLAALHANIADHPVMQRLQVVESGKANRSVFAWENITEIRHYWKVEAELGLALIEKLRDHLFSVGLRIKSWHGPGALASHAFNMYGIAKAKANHSPELYEIFRHAYAGGRFERFHIGRFRGPVWGYDINSAYPTAIALLPCLAGGRWHHVKNPTEIADYGVYRVQLRSAPSDKSSCPASPLFYRDHRGEVSFPWRVEGWYWSPEVKMVQRHLLNGSRYQFDDPPVIVEGWIFEPYHAYLPFDFLRGVYTERKRMKTAGIGAQMALKLLLNSLYGKMAQRAGWERDHDAPKWHQLDWAGWVTSYTRATLFDLMQRMQFSQLIAVETDGLYSTASPEQLGVTDSNELGGWEISRYDEMVYLQSGMYAKRTGDKWETKYRGLDASSLTAQRMVEYTRELQPQSPFWPDIDGVTTRFIGYRNALWRQTQNRGPLHSHLGRWETESRSINCMSGGKRIHVTSREVCIACRLWADAYELPHSTIVRPPRLTSVDYERLPFSQKHDIPWLDEASETPLWREHKEQLQGLLMVT